MSYGLRAIKKNGGAGLLNSPQSLFDHLAHTHTLHEREIEWIDGFWKRAMLKTFLWVLDPQEKVILS